MAWIESHQELRNHPKTKRLARQLGISVAAAIGHLHLFWWWAMDYAENGNLTKYDPEDIADAAGWEGDPRSFLDAMINCGPGGASGFIDKQGKEIFVHDWEDYIGRLLEKKIQNRERKIKSRSRVRQDQEEESREVPEGPAKESHDTQEDAAQDSLGRHASVTRDECVTDADVTQVSQGYQPNQPNQTNLTEPNPTRPNPTQPTPTDEGEGGGEGKSEGEGEGKEGSDVPNATVGKVIALWNSTLGPLGFPLVQKSTPARETHFRARLNEDKRRHALAWWGNQFEYMAQSKFLLDSAKEGVPWLTFDWVLNENNLVKISERKYSERRYKDDAVHRAGPASTIGDGHKPKTYAEAKALEEQQKHRGAIDAEFRHLGG